MSSRRLPGKVLLSLAGKPLLQHVIDALKRVPSLTGIVVATSIEKTDDPIAAYCQEKNIAWYRGSLPNVAQRFLEALEQQSWEGAVRVNADSPLLDWRLVDQAVNKLLREEWDLVTNVFPRSFPKGQSVEVVRTTAYQQAYKKFSVSEEFEHVMPYFYTHAVDWRIATIISSQDLSDTHLTVDTAEDLERIEKMIADHAKA